MKRPFLTSIISLGLSLLSAASFGQQMAEPPKRDILINNRVLARPVGKTITMMDVLKRLDMYFYRAFPELADSPEARYEFYLAHWRQALDDMINSELMLADAEEKKIPIHDGDVRQEMEQNFGPNVVETIDKMGLTFDEAWEMTKTELIVRQMNGYMVSSKAIAQIGPGRLVEAYDAFTEALGDTGTWRYRVLSVRDSNKERSEATAAAAYDLLCKGNPIDEVVALIEVMQGEGELAESTHVALSEPFERVGAEMATAHYEVVSGLETGAYSEPIAQTSRYDRSTVYRIFIVEAFEDPGLPPFGELQARLQNELFVEEASKAEEAYISKLRRRYGVEDDFIGQHLPADFTPVSLR